MDCKECRALAAAYIDNELDSAEALKLAAHLASCAECAAACEAQRLSQTAVRSHAGRHAAPDHLRRRVQAAIARAADEQGKPAQPSRRRFSWAWLNFGAAAAFGGAFALMLAIHLQAPSAADRFGDELVSDHFRSLMADHLTDVASSDHHTVKPWFTGKLDFSPPVHDLAPQGFPLIGGRLDYLGGRPAAALAYRHGNHLLNLFIQPAAGGRGFPEGMSTRQGFHVMHWTQDDMAYWAVSDMNPKEMEVFRKVLAAQVSPAG